MDKIEKLDLTFLDEDMAGILTRLCHLEDKANEFVDGYNEIIESLEYYSINIIKEEDNQ